MDTDDLNHLLLLGYIVADDGLWGEDEVMEVCRPQPEKEKRIWVREWIQRRHSDSSNTMYKLQREISEVSLDMKP